MAREMKDSGIEWIGEIPEDWEVKKMKRCTNIVMGQSPDSNDILSNGKILFMQGNREFGTRYPHPSLYCDSCKKYSRIGDILLSVRAPIGAINESDKVYGIGRGLCSIKADTIENNFLKYYLMKSIDNLKYYSNGSTFEAITIDVLQNFYIVSPDNGEQQRIAGFLDKKTAKLDNVLEKTRVSIEEYKKLKKAVITQAVTKGIRDGRKMRDSGIEWIGEIPLEWKTIKIKWILNERKEKSENGEEEPLSMSQKYGIIPTREMEMVPNMASSFIGAKIVHSGDLVFNKLKAHLGVFAVSRYNGLVSPDYAVYYSQGIADVKYLEYLFKTPQYIAEFRKRSSGVGVGLTRLYTDELYSICCLLPSQDEQKEIICYLNQKINEIDTLIAKKEQYLSEIENYKKSLIYEYVTGKKEVPQEY